MLNVIVNERGKLIEVLKGGNWVQMNHAFNKKDTIRGKHYHKITRELFYILSGEIAAEIQNVKTGHNKNIQLTAGDTLQVEPYEMHTLHSITDTEWIVLLSHEFDEKNPDMFK